MMFNATSYICLLRLAFEVSQAPNTMSGLRHQAVRLSYPPPVDSQLEMPFEFQQNITAALPRASEAPVTPNQAGTQEQNENPEPISKKAVSVQKPEYICPTGMYDMFYCIGCGGGKNIGPWTTYGEPNGECIGLADGMWEGCPCYEEDRDYFDSADSDKEPQTCGLYRSHSEKIARREKIRKERAEDEKSNIADEKAVEDKGQNENHTAEDGDNSAGDGDGRSDDGTGRADDGTGRGDDGKHGAEDGN
ncbi:hypothetical protein K491DRAFT_777667 [Lophiostoma macrostomum CBS 122681]|uniref:Uncharacterized protein n=1 Tax=Lophiostoma macrostomum CBS 122681 TaxID=1314788 RepID=A0A6A6TCZ8_9PLEO|nr:hypothetical protein K491DRAFT_777667 [Lophiostoma macrostomum CBS 122681]